uniref:Uncharacterized protein n=1 Tax=Dicentrarchus labrax TaxID=13489 RepID=A0A8P4GK44_DICLA
TFQPGGEYRAPRTHLGGGEPNPTARCHGSPESPPTSGRGSYEPERRHRTSSGRAGSSPLEEDAALQEKGPVIRRHRQSQTVSQ